MIWIIITAVLALAVGYALGVMMQDKQFLDLQHDLWSLKEWTYQNVVQNGKDAVLRAEARKVLTDLANE